MVCGTGIAAHKKQPSKIDPKTGLPPHPDDCSRVSLENNSQTRCVNPGVPRKQSGMFQTETLARHHQQRNLKLSQNQALEVAKVHRMLVKTHLTKMSTKETDEQQLRELLNDDVGLVAEYGHDDGDKVAMMHWSKSEDRKGEMNVTSGTSKLPLVDLETDPRMFAIFVEGRNATFCTITWVKAADAWTSAR